MRSGTLLVILAVTILGGGFWYEHATGVCRVPVTYRIGTIDERFSVSADELRRMALRAEAIWEEGTGVDLFVYTEDEDALPINLVFDDRQEKADLEAEYREDLEAKEGMTESVAKQYEDLIAEFRKIKKQYETRVVAYETSLQAYNAEVTEWNDKGGAPQEVADELNEKEKDLRGEYEELDALSTKLNNIVTDLNQIGARGNSLIADYNSIVEKYNREFSEAREFTQGDYTRQAISIYQFDTEDELVLVLAHEFGHALALDHVENEESIMYHFMEHQTPARGLTEEDMRIYVERCTDTSPVLSVLKFASRLW